MCLLSLFHCDYIYLPRFRFNNCVYTLNVKNVLGFRYRMLQKVFREPEVTFGFSVVILRQVISGEESWIEVFLTLIFLCIGKQYIENISNRILYFYFFQVTQSKNF
jgi:hypothetical protein